MTASQPPGRPPTASRYAGLVLAAGTASRFGGGKVRAPLDGRPLVAHVLANARAAGLGRVVLVLGRDAEAVRGALLSHEFGALEGVTMAVNPAPERGLATSLRLGLAVATGEPAPEGVVIFLGDQPRVRADVVLALVEAIATAPPGAVAVVPAYADDGAPNPVLVLPALWPLAARLEGDRGLGPLLAADPERVVRVPVTGANPDVDTPADLAALEGNRT